MLCASRLTVMSCLFSLHSIAMAQPATRVVSMDHCADQYVLALLQPQQIAALSPDAEKDFSYFRAQAKGLAKLRPRAEEILLAQPDIVVRAYGGDAQIAGLLQRAGVRYLQLPWVNDWAGALKSLRMVAQALGALPRAEAIIAGMPAIEPGQPRATNHFPSLMYLTPGGVTTGPGSLIHELIQAAGFDNFQNQPGWQVLPLERLLSQQPDVIAAAFFSGQLQHLDYWSAMRHPIAKRQLQNRPIIQLDKASLGCSAWFAFDAYQRLAQGYQSIQAPPR